MDSMQKHILKFVIDANKIFVGSFVLANNGQIPEFSL
jgi:hypothetical protein